MRSFLALAALAGCAGPPASTGRQGLTAEGRAERFALIRDTAAQLGIYNASLIAGIAISETNLAHCQSEATWACQGPASSSCGGGPIIAGAADGPCADMQGGLGMFQLDAGTYADTVAMYGPQILTVEGNTAQAVSFVIDKVRLDIDGVGDWLGATAWINAVPIDAALPVMAQWAALLACRYNGCCTTSATCTARANGYRDNAIAAWTEMGAAFWQTSNRCAALPADGVIDQRSACYLAAGDPRHWRRETTAGYGGGLEWTLTTSDAAPANFAQWIVKPGKPGRFHIEVHLDGGIFGRSRQAAYSISHAGLVDTVIVDQTSASGFVSLGDFELAGSGDEYVRLGDNTGEAGTRLMFDAVRVRPVGGGGGAGGERARGGCNGCSIEPGGAAGGGALVAIGVIVLRRRRVSERRATMAR